MGIEKKVIRQGRALGPQSDFVHTFSTSSAVTVALVGACGAACSARTVAGIL